MSVMVIGDAFIDLIVPAENINPGETYHRKIAMSVGGLSNAVIEISKLGGEVKFVGKVGDDPFGKCFRQSLRENRIKDLILVDPELPTGLCISLVNKDGERAMVANRGANDNLSLEDIEIHIDEIRNSRTLYFSGYSLLNEKVRNSILFCVRECHKEGAEIYFNPGAPNLIRKKFKEIIKNFVDVLILNQDEARILANGSANLQSLNNLAELVVVTRGREGCSIVKNREITNVGANKINVSDTTGAGDAFAAGFIVGRIRNLNFDDCAKLGNKTAQKFLKEERGL